MIRVLGPRQKCKCGADATNHHINTCSRLVRIWRHDAVLDEIENGIKMIGKHTKREPMAAPGLTQKRPDLRSDEMVIDAMITYADSYSRSSEQPKKMKAGNHAASLKDAKWSNWAANRGLTYASFIVESTGGFHEAGRRWLRQVIGEADSPIAISTVFNYVTGRCLRAMLHGTVGLFAEVAF